MPRSIYVLFVSQYPNAHHLEVGDEYIARIAAFNYENKRFQIVEIEESEEDGHPVYLYHGRYLGNP